VSLSVAMRYVPTPIRRRRRADRASNDEGAAGSQIWSTADGWEADAAARGAPRCADGRTAYRAQSGGAATGSPNPARSVVAGAGGGPGCRRRGAPGPDQAGGATAPTMTAAEIAIHRVQQPPAYPNRRVVPCGHCQGPPEPRRRPLPAPQVRPTTERRTHGGQNAVGLVQVLGFDRVGSCRLLSFKTVGLPVVVVLATRSSDRRSG